MKLFSENFVEVKSDEDLNLLCNNYSNYDRGYLCQATYILRKKVRAWMEDLWTQYETYADTHFLEEFKRQFTQRTWELYLGATLLNRGFKLGLRKDDGPDFQILNNKNSTACWIEAIAVTKGTGPDKVPELVYNGVSNIPTDEIVLRISNGLNVKYKKYLSDCEKGLIGEKEPYVIALDRSELDHVDVLLPNILKALFGVGNLALRMRVGGKPVKNPENFWTHEPIINKRSGESVSMHFFDNLLHSGISAVIYSRDGIINSPRKLNEMGENFFIVHNPQAKNPLPSGFFPFGEEYTAKAGFIQKTRKNSDFSYPDPFEHLNH